MSYLFHKRYNLASDEKIIVFNLPIVFRTGIQPIIAHFPYRGRITAINAFCSTPSSSDIEIAIEKLPFKDFKDNIDNWENILRKNVIILSNEVVDNKHYKIKQYYVNSGDVFRLNILKGEGISGLTVQITIMVY